MKRNEEAHAACLNILSDNKDSAPRIAELCTLSRRLGSEVDALTAERDELKRRLGAICEYAAHNKRNQRFIAIAEGKS